MANIKPEPSKVCPVCGHCQECGRGPQTHLVYPYPQPYWVWYPSPVITSPTVTTIPFVYGSPPANETSTTYTIAPVAS